MHWQVANWLFCRTLAAQQRARAMPNKGKSKRGANLKGSARISWQYVIEYRKGESGDAVFKAVMAQRSKRHRDTSDPRSRQAEARMEAAALAAM